MELTAALNIGDIIAARTVSKLLDSSSEVLADGFRMLPSAQTTAREASALAQGISPGSAAVINSAVTQPIEALLSGATHVSVRGVQMEKVHALWEVRGAAKQLSRAWNIELPAPVAAT